MKSIYYAVSIAIITMSVLTGCTSTQQTDQALTVTTPTNVNYLTADKIRAQVLDHTIEGTASFPRLGEIPFKQFYESSTGIYRDRIIRQGNVETAFGTHRLTEDGRLCRTSKSRGKGKETCFKFSKTNDQYRIYQAGQTKSTVVTLTPGKTF